MIFREKIEIFKRVKKWTVSKRVSGWILSKNRNFSYSYFFYRNYGHFRKGLVHGFCRNIEISLISVFHRNYVRKNRF